MEALCWRYAITEHVRFTGWIPYERVAAHIALADLVAMPSEYEALARVYLASARCLLHQPGLERRSGPSR